ncbi:proline-rich protein HaeIII subfamily 1-like [Lingula anatina]|uniref:Proline-rich protein HaeIII subfamily 1-like n=1 Tax=Lingula anatina TaxID=7574 RepID=A0A1S3H753_LINAN|nr:proline-rich protein HaeIII subfamily 1-like [Lingula anatina]|eukprot:XP_013381311.1 proline-rich protein HaeIII subfamily 1-like [Lingula anatina]
MSLSVLTALCLLTSVLSKSVPHYQNPRSLSPSLLRVARDNGAQPPSGILPQNLRQGAHPPGGQPLPPSGPPTDLPEGRAQGPAQDPRPPAPRLGYYSAAARPRAPAGPPAPNLRPGRPGTEAAALMEAPHPPQPSPCRSPQLWAHSAAREP